MKTGATDKQPKVIPPRTNIRNEKFKAHRLQQGIKEHKNKVQDSQKKEHGLLAELEGIDRQLLAQNRKLASLREQYNDQENLLLLQQENLSRTIAEKEALKNHVQKRLIAYYQMGSIGLMNVIFSRESLTELLSFQEFFQNMIQYDQSAIASYQAKITDLNKRRETIETEKNRLSQLLEQVTKEEETLTTIHTTKTTLLNRVKTEKKLYQQAAEELEKAAADLAATIERLKKKSKKSKRDQASTTAIVISGTTKKKWLKTEKGFASQKGKLNPPVKGTVIPNNGQGNFSGFSTTSSANGIDILTANDQTIKAVYDGKVIHSGYLRGYGNMIIIDHGQNYYSIVSQAARIFKEEGTTVVKDDAIGVTGNEASLLGEGLHFEIRHGSSPEDPLQWIKKDSLSFSNPNPKRAPSSSLRNGTTE